MQQLEKIYTNKYKQINQQYADEKSLKHLWNHYPNLKTEAHEKKKKNAPGTPRWSYSQ